MSDRDVVWICSWCKGEARVPYKEGGYLPKKWRKSDADGVLCGSCGEAIDAAFKAVKKQRKRAGSHEEDA